MKTCLCRSALVAVLGLLAAQSASAYGWARAVAVGAAPVLQFDGTGAGTAVPPARAERPARWQAAHGEAEVEAPPPLATPDATEDALEDDGFQRYFDRHFRVHPLTAAEPHRHLHLD